MTAVEYQTSVATNAAGIDNAGSKWSREAHTKFVPPGLRQDSIINESFFHYNRKYFLNPHLFASEPLFGRKPFQPHPSEKSPPLEASNGGDCIRSSLKRSFILCCCSL